MKHFANGVSLNYEIHGAKDDPGKPWVIFSHSLACSTAMWAPQVDEFARDYRVLAFDTRGHGASDAPEGPYTLDELADDLRSLMDALKIERAHFVGLSMGGMIGQVFALRYPAAFRGLTIADSTSKWPPEAAAMFAERVKIARTRGMDALVESTLSRWFTPPFHKSHPAEVAKIGHAIRTTPVAGYAGCSHAIPQVNTTAQLKQISCPILIIVGRDDPGTPLSMSQEIHDSAHGSRLAILDHAAHISNIEQPKEFNRVLGEFLATHR